MSEFKKQLFLSTLILSCLIPSINANAAPKWRTAYLTNQDTLPGTLAYQPLSAVPWGKYTHVIQSSLIPTAINGVPGINTCDYSIECVVGNVTSGNAQAFVDAAHKGGAKALVSLIVGNDDPNSKTTQATDMVINTRPANVDKFVDVLTDFIDKYKYDGIDIDWEGIAPTYNGMENIKVSATAGSPTSTIKYTEAIYDVTGAYVVLYYTITATNPGATTASGVTVTNNLPVGLTYASHTAPLGTTCSNITGSVTCNVGDLASGASAVITLGVDFAGEIQFPPFIRKLRAALGPDKVITLFSPLKRELRSTQTHAHCAIEPCGGRRVTAITKSRIMVVIPNIYLIY